MGKALVFMPEAEGQISLFFNLLNSASASVNRASVFFFGLICKTDAN